MTKELRVGDTYTTRVGKVGREDIVATEYEFLGYNEKANPMVRKIKSWREKPELPESALSEKFRDYIAVGIVGLVFFADWLSGGRILKLSELEE